MMQYALLALTVLVFLGLVAVLVALRGLIRSDTVPNAPDTDLLERIAQLEVEMGSLKRAQTDVASTMDRRFATLNANFSRLRGAQQFEDQMEDEEQAEAALRQAGIQALQGQQMIPGFEGGAERAPSPNGPKRLRRMGG